jgi:hypothetical protein
VKRGVPPEKLSSWRSVDRLFSAGYGQNSPNSIVELRGTIVVLHRSMVCADSLPFRLRLERSMLLI